MRCSWWNYGEYNVDCVETHRVLYFVGGWSKVQTDQASSFSSRHQSFRRQPSSTAEYLNLVGKAIQNALRRFYPKILSFLDDSSCLSRGMRILRILERNAFWTIFSCCKKGVQTDENAAALISCKRNIERKQCSVSFVLPYGIVVN